MKIFNQGRPTPQASTPQATRKKESVGPEKSKMKKTAKSTRQNLTPDQIREKIKNKDIEKASVKKKIPQGQVSEFWGETDFDGKSNILVQSNAEAKAKKLAGVEKAKKLEATQKKAEVAGPTSGKIIKKVVAGDEIIEKEIDRNSDVDLNDPTDPATHEKLKNILVNNSFGFSDKERHALEQILAD